MDWKIEVVVMPVADVDRAVRFYGEQLGFAVDHDTRVGDQMRVVQLTPPGSGCSVVVGTGLVKSAPGSVQGIQLVVDDIEAARSTLVANGVDVGEIVHYEGATQLPGRGDAWNSFCYFSDPDGNGWAIQERPAS